MMDGGWGSVNAENLCSRAGERALARARRVESAAGRERGGSRVLQSDKCGLLMDVVYCFPNICSSWARSNHAWNENFQTQMLMLRRLSSNAQTRAVMSMK